MNIKFMLDELNNYVLYMEDFIQQSIDEFDIKYNVEKVEAIKDSDPDYYNWQIDDLSEKWNEISMVYPNNFRKAFFTQIYSGVESKLIKICKTHHDRKKTKRLFGDKGSEIGKAKEYLIKVADVDFKDLMEDYLFIDKMRLIRNSIIHNEGAINSGHRDWDNVYKAVKATAGKIMFDANPEEIQEDEIKPLYLTNPNLKFKFLIPNAQLNSKFILTTKNFFEKLLDKDLF